MPTFDQEQTKRKELQDILEQLSKIQPESLVRTDVLGRELSFEAGLPVFRRTLGLFKDLFECNLDNIPYETLNQMSSVAQQALTHFQAIQKFSLQQHPSNPAQARDQLINQLRDAWHTYYSNITPQISYSIRRGTDFDALEREARGTLTLQKQIITDLKTEKDKTLAEMQGALEKVRQAAAEAGVAQHAIHFKQEADSHLYQSYWWLGSTILFGVLTVMYALLIWDHQLLELSSNAPVDRPILLTFARVLPRVVVISILSFGLIWSARNFAASRHNFVINRHRQNALSTFETFVKAAGDEQTKNAVLVQATQSIFSPQASGYSKGETEPKQGSQIVEIVRGLSGTK